MGPSHRWMPNVGRCTVGNARIHRITLSIRNQLPKSSQIFSGCSDELRWKANRDNINSMSSAQLRGWPSHNYYYQYCSGICNDVVDDHACYVVVYICSNEHNCHHTPDMHRVFLGSYATSAPCKTSEKLLWPRNYCCLVGLYCIPNK